MTLEPAPFRLCMVTYRRRVPWIAAGATPYPCTSPRDHEGEHSWQALADADEAEMTVRRLRENAAMAPVEPMDGLLKGIFEGKFDEHLEKILAVGHERKRARRGVRTFE